MKLKNLFGFLILLTSKAFALGWSGLTLNGEACNGGGQGFGPFDYLQVVNSPKESALYRAARLWEVDRIHYGKGLEKFKSEGLNPRNVGRIHGEYDYTLRAFPNHSKALYALINLEVIRLKQNKFAKQKTPPLRTPPECYLQRAMVFRPKQAHIYQLYAIYLQKLKHYESAQRYYIEALKLESHNSELHYNYGLLLFNLKKFDEAKLHASKAEALNYPLSGLKDKLIREGYWE